MDFLLRQRENNRFISAFFGIPGVTTACIKTDWLHVMDLGVSSDWVGSILFFLMEKKIPGNSRADKCATIYQDLKDYYNRTPDCDSRLPKLTPTMLRFEDNGRRKTPKIRAKAGECRGMIPWLLDFAQRHLQETSAEEAAMLAGSRRLAAMYNLLRTATWNPQTFEAAAREFLLIFAALEESFQTIMPGCKLFKVKPKGHLLLELSLTETNPSSRWTYRDEAFGHSLALLAKRRGGKFSPLAVGNSVLMRFMSNNSIPTL